MPARFGPVAQIAFVTRDIEGQMRFYASRMGIGPWFYTERSPMESVRYRGRPVSVHLSVGVAFSGGIQIELLQQRDDGASVYRDWMTRPFERQLQHHIAMWPVDFGAKMDLARAAGYEVVQEGGNARGGFAFLLHPENPDGLIEFTEATPGRIAYREAAARAAREWDGRDPVRPFESLAGAG